MRVLSIGILFHRPQCERELLYEVEVSEKEVREEGVIPVAGKK